MARSAGVSAMTVARVFNGSGPVAPETRKIILGESRRLNYFPNALVKGVKGQRTKTVGIVFNAASPGTTAGDIHHVVEELQRHDYLAYIRTFIPREADLNRILRAYLSQRVDGVIIWSDYPAFPFSKEIATLLEHFTASVFVTSNRLKYMADQVVLSPFGAIADAADHFVKTGRRRPSIFASLPVNKSKVDAFLGRLEFHGLKTGETSQIDPLLDRMANQSYFDREFSSALARRFGRTFPFDSLLVSSDEGAAATMEYLKTCGLKIPEDVAVCGYNNYGLSKYLSPPLASIDLNFKEAAIASAEMLFMRLKDKTLPQQIKELPLRFVWRESAGTISDLTPMRFDRDAGNRVRPCARTGETPALLLS
ncbi:MAG: LacI family DNA-binding transcriptional regulator [Terrimicrobiaceae bacterium]